MIKICSLSSSCRFLPSPSFHMSPANFYEKGPKKRGGRAAARGLHTRLPALCQYGVSHGIAPFQDTQPNSSLRAPCNEECYHSITEKIMFPSPSLSLCPILTSFGAEERCAAEKGRSAAGLERQHHKSRLDRVRPSDGRMRMSRV